MHFKATGQQGTEGSNPSTATIDRRPLLYSNCLCLCCGSAHNLFESRRHLLQIRPRTYRQSDKVSTQLQPKLCLCCSALGIHCWKTSRNWKLVSKEITLVSSMKVNGKRICLFPPRLRTKEGRNGHPDLAGLASGQTWRKHPVCPGVPPHFSRLLLRVPGSHLSRKK